MSRSELLMLPAALVAGLLVWRVARGELASRLAALLAAGAVASALVFYPGSVWRAAKGARAAAGIPSGEAELDGAARARFDAGAVEQVRRIIPETDTYYLQAAVEPGGRAFRFWSFNRLLPRIAVAAPETADWIVTWRLAPDELGVALDEVRRVDEKTYVARVAR